MAKAGEMLSSEELAKRLMPPPPPTRTLGGNKQAVVLDEDAYTQKLEAIIQRDYFPDIPKLQNQLEWLQAVNSKDPIAIRQAQLNIARRRAGLKTPAPGSTPSVKDALGGTPGTWNTPATARQVTPAMTPLAFNQAPSTPAVGQDSSLTATPGGRHHTATHPSAPVEELAAPPMSLDTFVSQYTSEDNASFAKLLDKDNARKRVKHSHHLDDKTPKLLLGAAANPTDEYGSGGQEPGTLRLWPHVAKNQMYYVQASRQLTDKELQDRVQGPPKAIVMDETRMDASAGAGEAAAAAAGMIANIGTHMPPGMLQPTAAAGKPGGTSHAAGVGPGSTAGGDGGRDGGQALGYLATPSIVPGVDASPFMTWGDVGSTPLRLDEFDDPVGPAGQTPGIGNNFKLPEVRAREQLGRTLAQKTGYARGSLQRSANARSTPILHHPGLKRHRGTGDRAAALSPAAHKLMASRKGGNAGGGGGLLQRPASSLLGGGDLDKELRASYTKAPNGGASESRPSSRFATPNLTPRQTPGRAATPLVGTAVRAGGGAKLMAAAGGGSAAAGGAITDDLLKL